MKYKILAKVLNNNFVSLIPKNTPPTSKLELRVHYFQYKTSKAILNLLYAPDSVLTLS